MSGLRYVAWLSSGDSRPFRTETFATLARGEGLQIVAGSPGLVIAAEPGQAARGGPAVLIGETFRAGSAEPLSAAQALAAAAPVEPLAGVMDRIWGDYVLFGFDPSTTARIVFKSPFGRLPCFWAQIGHGVVCASSLSLLQSFGAARPAVDWAATRRYLLATEFRNGTTCLATTSELQGGHALSVGMGAAHTAPLWSPWRFACSESPLSERTAAAKALGAAVDRAVAARTARANGSVLLLSGGLDSSVVAAALAKAERSFVTLNLVGRERSGDERVYARAVASRLAVPLSERQRSTAAIDWADPGLARLPRPADRVFRQPSLRAARRLADQTGAGLILDGGGGDNVFCSLQSVAPILDRLRLEDVRAAWPTAREIALLCDASVPAVARQVAVRLISRRVRFRWLIDASFLVTETPDAAVYGPAHPWLDPPPGALPGQAAHVALALAAASINESLDPAAALPVVSPLVAQPVVETALRVRSWLWFRGGRNRAVIRDAFADRLPKTVLDRQGKGTPAGFMAEIVARERDRLRELLLDGLLAANGVADRPAIERYLADRNPPRSFDFARLLQLADAELWARSWA